MKKIITTFLVLIVAIQIIAFLYWQTNKIVIHTQIIKDSQLASFFDSLKVVQISDLHIDSFGSREKKLIDLIDKINPHLIFVTGDFVGKDSNLNPVIEVMGRIAENREVFVVLGNSDHEFKNREIDTKKLIEGLKEKGVHILVNQSIKLKLATDSLYIIGLDDNYLWKDDFFIATANLPSKSKKILLAHSPDIASKINLDNINLILSGHTHGGQVKLPFLGAIYTNRTCNSAFKFVSGLYYYQKVKVYVNQGIGTSFFPLRFLCRPEITLFKFEKE